MVGRRSSRIYTFASFRLDARRRLLSSRTDDQLVPLPTASFDTLLYLVEHAGEVVEKSALMRAVWPHVTVEENSLSQSISVLRRALGESPSEHRFVVTVPGRGFRFIAQVTSESETERRALAAIASTDPDAFQLYVTSWWALTRPGGGNLEGALQHLEQALLRDPNFALAHVCIADCYAMLGAHGLRRPHEVFPKARSAVLRALEIDSELAEAHAELGFIHFIYDFDVERSQRAFRRALEANPQCFIAHRYLGALRIACGDTDSALCSFRLAQTVQPLAVHINANIGMAYYFGGRYDQAVLQLETTLKMQPSFDVARSFLGRSFLRIGDFERAIHHFTARTEMTAGAAADIPTVYALSGRCDEAEEELDKLLRSAERSYVSPYDIALIHAALQHDEAAFDWLERAVEQRVFAFFKLDPAFQRLHGQPRFTRVLEQFGVGKL
jgi:DNA-binding winged helix-turn-helix (wHTH) protein/Tfp pilus assembly protein PilF